MWWFSEAVLAFIARGSKRLKLNSKENDDMSNTITVSKCDNELVVLAYQWGASFELCRILSGNTQPVNVTLNILPGPYTGTIVLNGVNQPLSQTITQNLAGGTYSILLLGIDWGGPAEFTVNLNDTTYTLPLQPTGDGLLFNKGPFSITVPNS
jgi:hypothetical protein